MWIHYQDKKNQISSEPIDRKPGNNALALYTGLQFAAEKPKRVTDFLQEIGEQMFISGNNASYLSSMSRSCGREKVISLSPPV